MDASDGALMHSVSLSMERFTAYADAFTGINPFLTKRPPQLRLPAPLRALVIAVRFALLALVCAPLLLLVNVVLSTVLLSWLPVVGVLLAHALDVLVCRVTLLVLGFARVHAVGLAAGAAVRAGDIIVTNYTGVIDVLVWRARLTCPRFAYPTLDGKFETCGFGAALWRALHPHATLSNDGAPLAHARQCGAPVVLFAEGVTTNNLCVLRFASPIGGDDRGVILPAGIRHTGATALGASVLGVVYGLVRSQSLAGTVSLRVAYAPSPLNNSTLAEVVAQQAGVPAASIDHAIKKEFVREFSAHIARRAR